VSLSAQVLLGLGLGIGAGIFLGEIVAPVGFVGRAFILLLQMTVLPYVAISLVKALGSLSAREAVDLVRKAGGFLLLLWGVALLTVMLIPLTFPDWTAASFFSNTLVESPPPFDFLSLFIPANPFESLANNVVPAVVVFSVSLGVALIGIEDTAPFIGALATLTDALGRIAGFVVRLAPIGVFAIAAEAAGTMDVSQVLGLQVYLAAYIVAALFLSLWVLPGLVAALTPFRYREIVGMTRAGLVTAFATGNVFVVLSILSEKSKELARLHVETSEECESFVEVVVPTAYTLPSVGKLLALAFVLFAGWLSGFSVSYTQYPAFAVSGLFTFFGNTFVAIPFLLDQFRVPADTFQLFVIADSVIGGRFGSLVAAMHILCLALLAASSSGGVLVFRWARVLRFVAISSVAGGVLLLGVRLGFESMGHQYEGYKLFVSRGLQSEGAPARVLDGLPAELPAVDRSVPTLERIRQRGVLRVGFRRDSLPQAFFNERAELVGFDVELLHTLARDLGVRIEFVATSIADLPDLLGAGYLDVAAGVPITPERLAQLDLSAPYHDETLAFIVPDHRRDEFSTRKAVKALAPLRLGVPRASYYINKVRAYLPQAELIEIDSPRSFLRKELDVDAIVFSAEAGSAWCLIYPEFNVAVPHPDVLQVPFGLPVARGNGEMIAFLNGWIELKRRDGTLERLFDYWMRGVDQERRAPRWSVIRDVLHWVE
jgi:Na+/H+-dicarboxylate symporter